MALSPEQTVAADERAQPGRTVVVVAGPGSGKTRVLTDRIVEAIRRGVPPEQILAVTFTRKAAEEMRRRVFDLLAEDGGRPKMPTVTTLHAWAAELLHRHGHKINLDGSFGVLDQIDTDNVRKMLRETGLAKNAAAYDELLRSANVLDYDLLERRAQLLLPRLGFRLYQEVLVDEMQDLSEAEYDLIDHLRGTEAGLFAVGDPRQSVFEWRGASPRASTEWQEVGTTHHLLDNYRSAPVITRFVDELAGFPGFVSRCTTDGRVDVGCIDPIVWLHSLDRVGDWGSVAVLGRSWRTLQAFAELLDGSGIPNVVYSPSLYGWDTPWGRAVSYLFRLERLGLEGATDSVLVQLLAHSVGLGADLPYMRMTAARKRCHIADVIPPARVGQSTWSLRDLLNRAIPMQVRVHVLLKAIDVEPSRAFRILDVERWAENLDGWWSWFMFRDLQDRIQEGNHVHLLTPYGAKGLEWDHVVVPDASSRTYHLGDPELRRVLFVAASRPRRSLLITWPAEESRSLLLPPEEE